MDSHGRDVFRQVAERTGTTIEEMLAGAATAGTVANLSCGFTLD